MGELGRTPPRRLLVLPATSGRLLPGRHSPALGDPLGPPRPRGCRARSTFLLLGQQLRGIQRGPGQAAPRTPRDDPHPLVAVHPLVLVLGPANELGTEGRAWGRPDPAREASAWTPALPRGLRPTPSEDRGHLAGGTSSSAVWDAVSGQVSGHTPTPLSWLDETCRGAGPRQALAGAPHNPNHTWGVRRHCGAWRALAAQGLCPGAPPGRTAHRWPTWRAGAGDITFLPGVPEFSRGCLCLATTQNGVPEGGKGRPAAGTALNPFTPSFCREEGLGCWAVSPAWLLTSL